MKIISGGQTGIDRAALDVALSLGLKCGGWCPEGRGAEDGPIPEKYPLTEIPGGTTDDRTARNVRDADGTVIFHSRLPLTGGTKTTADRCREMKKPQLLIDAEQRSTTAAAQELDRFVRQKQLEILNVAGPRASQWPDGYEFASAVLREFCQLQTQPCAPDLSFVVPAHNEERELPGSLQSIRQAAQATGKTFELIVVDDASTDATPRIAGEFGARVVHIDRRQIAAARNAGAHHACGNILFFVDADSRIGPALVRGAIAALDAGFSGGSARVEPDRALPLWGTIFLRGFATLYFATGLGAGAFLFTRRELFEAVGGFDEQFFAGEEVFFSLALKKRGRFKILREPFITSARKLRMYSPAFVAGQLFLLMLKGRRALKTRDRLGLWYDGKREGPAVDEKVECASARG